MEFCDKSCLTLARQLTFTPPMTPESAWQTELNAQAYREATTISLPLRATRRWCALGLLALHLGIELVADVGMWQFMMAGAVCAFLPDEWFRWIPGLGERENTRENTPPDARSSAAKRGPAG